MMKYLFIILSCLGPIFAFASIEKVKSMIEVEAHFNNIEEPLREATVGIFDINETLALAADPIFQRQNFKPHVEMLRKITQTMTPDQRIFFMNLINVALPLQLIESDTPSLLAKLQQQKIKIMALTAAMTGRIGEIDSEEHVYQELKKLGIDFALSFAELGELQFNSFSSYRNNYPSFKHGLLFTNGENIANAACHPKGAVLVHFFKQTKLSPKIVVMVDDKLENLKNIEAALKEFNPEIKYLGLHYTRTQETAPQVLDATIMKEAWEIWVKRTQDLCR